ncbi:hypothetical protein PR202_ga22784 [Eleusine coracana subsp. coracana]|uniref:DUF1618 domain-containing protein n=1 Tax=Eleusine coracana subsp. coracana TaxID=191504 RepID=A0AAV5D443_ELECO|nr:hypothetical protein PR202_ga22784 [Eleusine coracana subsp. coracana]
MSFDCVGRPIRASLRPAAPPAVSRLHLHWTGRPAIKRTMAEPTVIGAHRHAILFELTVPFDDPETWRHYHAASFPIDYFVYSSATSPPSLTRLLFPPCFEGGAIFNPRIDGMFLPFYRNQRQRTMVERDMGILCCHDGNGDDDEFTFTVADLSHRDWHHVKKLPIPPNLTTKLRSFWSDTVLAVDERRLCWVDYYQGLLLIDVLADRPQLHYIPLPAEAMQSRRPYIDAFAPDPFRCVCVVNDDETTAAGGTIIIKLVCIIIINKRTSLPAFTIKTWTLNINNYQQGHHQWNEDFGGTTMDADEFFGLYYEPQVDQSSSNSLLSRVQPRFTLVSLVNPHVISFCSRRKRTTTTSG